MVRGCRTVGTPSRDRSQFHRPMELEKFIKHQVSRGREYKQRLVFRRDLAVI